MFEPGMSGENSGEKPGEKPIEKPALKSYQVTTPSFFRSKIWSRNRTISSKLGKGKITLVSGETSTSADDCEILGDSDVRIIDPGSNSFLEASKRKRGYDAGRKFQENWATMHPWAENVMDNGEVSAVKCRVCTKIEGRDKILQPKLDGLWKHAERKHAETDIPKLKVRKGDLYINPLNKHVLNEKLVLSLGRDTIVQQLAQTATVERRNRQVQFTAIFQLLSLGRLMTDYEASLPMFQKLKVPDCPSTHWTDSFDWEMANTMADQVIAKTKTTLASANFISLSADEVTSVDNTQWLSMHAYTVLNWKRVPLLLSLTKVTKGCGANALKEQICDSITYHGGLTDRDLSKKLICFGADGVSVFQGLKSGVMAQLIEEQSPYMMAIHCMAHRTNLAVKSLSELPFVKKVEALCTQMHSHFSHSPKKWREFQLLAEVLETGGLKMLKNVKTRWISVKEPLQRIQDYYPTLVAKMHIDLHDKSLKVKQRASAGKNYELLCDVQTLLCLPCLLPLLNCVNELIKFAQSRDMYVCDYISTVKMCQTELSEMYLDSSTVFKGVFFNPFIGLVEGRSYILEHDWKVDLETGVEYLSYRVGEHSYPSHFINAETMKRQDVTRGDFDQCVLAVKGQCRDAAECIVTELSERFPNSDLQNALGIVFPQFWSQPDSDTLFPLHLVTIKRHFSEPRCIDPKEGSGKERTAVIEPLCGSALDAQASFFKLSMRSAWEKAMGEPSSMNPLTKLWQTFAASGIHWMKVPEYFKLAKIVVVTVIGSVEDERTFSNLAFIKTRVRNKLSTNLDCTVRLYSQDFWNMNDFPYQDAITVWKEKRDRRGGAI